MREVYRIPMFNHHDTTRNAFMLHGPLARCCYDWWWHSFTAQDNVCYGASKPLRDAEAFAMLLARGGHEERVSGHDHLERKKYTVSPDKSYGCADKNWGRDFTSPWVWLSSSCLFSRRTGKYLQNSVFDIGGGQPKIYCVKLYDRKDGRPELVDVIEATHIGCEYGEYDRQIKSAF